MKSEKKELTIRTNTEKKGKYFSGTFSLLITYFYNEKAGTSSLDLPSSLG